MNVLSSIENRKISRESDKGRQLMAIQINSFDFSVQKICAPCHWPQWRMLNAYIFLGHCLIWITSICNALSFPTIKNSWSINTVHTWGHWQPIIELLEYDCYSTSQRLADFSTVVGVRSEYHPGCLAHKLQPSLWEPKGIKVRSSSWGDSVSMVRIS